MIGGLGCLLGVALGVQFHLPLLSAAIAAVLLVVVLFTRPAVLVLGTSIFFLSILFGWWRCQTVVLSRPFVSDLNGNTMFVTGRVASDPIVSGNEQNFQLLVSSVSEESRRFKVLVTAWHLPVFEYSDKISGQLKFSLPKDSDNFSYSNYLAKDNIHILGDQAGKLASTPSSNPSLLKWLYRVKHFVNLSIHRFLPEPHSGLLAGLLLGIKADLSEDFRTALKNSGTSHIVALSGFNITIIITFLLFTLRRLPRRFVWIASGILILGFVIMTGAASSVIRAAIMGWLLLLASMWGRQRSATNAVLLAAVIMVLLQPMILFYDIGFQLSVAATVGLLYCSPLFLWNIKYVPQFLIETFSTTVGATLFTMPLIALYFGGFSWVTLGANIIVVPLVPYAMLLGFVGMILFLLIPTLQWLSLLVWPLSALIFSVINWFGNLPSAFVPLPALPIWVPISYYLILVIIILYVQHRRSSSSSLD